MKSLEELRAIKARMQDQMGIRSDDAEAGKIVISMGTAGIAAGAKDVVLAFSENLCKNKIYDIGVIQDGNAVWGDSSPVVEVYLNGQDKVTYVNMTAEKVAKVVSEHIVNGNVVTEYTAG